MHEYLKVLPNKNCRACEIYHCVNTQLFATDVQKDKEIRKVGRVRYDQMYLRYEHELSIADCPTNKIIDDTQKLVGKGLHWKLVEDSTLNRALSALDKPLISYSESMMVFEGEDNKDK